MALITCRECGTQVSSRATACPRSGSPIKKKSSFGGCLAAILLSVVVIIVIAVSSSTESSKPTKTMAVEIDKSRDSLTIHNIGTPDIEGQAMVVYINGTPPFTYKAVCSAPAVGNSVRVPLNTFAKKDGQIFNPLAYTVTEVWIGGSGYDYKQFQ